MELIRRFAFILLREYYINDKLGRYLTLENEVDSMREATRKAIIKKIANIVENTANNEEGFFSIYQQFVNSN